MSIEIASFLTLSSEKERGKALLRGGYTWKGEWVGPPQCDAHPPVCAPMHREREESEYFSGFCRTTDFSFPECAVAVTCTVSVLSAKSIRLYLQYVAPEHFVAHFISWLAIYVQVRLGRFLILKMFHNRSKDAMYKLNQSIVVRKGEVLSFRDIE